MPLTLTHPDHAASAVLEVLRRAGFDMAQPVAATRVVLDTFDGRLAAAGLRLEHRRDADVAVVLEGGAGSPPARLVGATVPRWPAGLPAGPLRDRLSRVTRERALVPLLTVTSELHRGTRIDRRGKARVHAEVHEVIRAQGSDVPGWVVELREVAGHEDDLASVVTRLRSIGLVEEGADVASVVAARAGVSIEGEVRPPTVPMERDEPAPAVFRRVLANLADTIEANREGTIDDLDSEFLHDLRVAVRRTRSVLAEAKGVLPDDVRRSYRERFGWLGQRTGLARDLDVYLIGWDEYVAPLGNVDTASLERVREEIEARRVAAHVELAVVLQGEEYEQLLESWRSWLAVRARRAEKEEAIGRVVARRVEKAHGRLVRDGRRITPDSPSEDLHDLRKDAKKLRYLLECFSPAFPSTARKAFVGQLKDLQDNLGAHQDAEVHLGELRELARDLHARSVVDTDALLAMGRLSDQLERRRAHERADFADRFARFDRKGNRKLLEQMVRKARRP